MNTSDKQQIDLIAIAKTIVQNKKTIYKSIIICASIGLLIAFFSTKKYEAVSVFFPQTSSSKKLSGSLNGMTGINSNNLGDFQDLPPALYPQIISSPSFCKDLMQLQLKLENGNSKVSFLNYFTDDKYSSFKDKSKKYTIGLPELLIKALKGNKENNALLYNSPITALNKNEYELQQLIKNIVKVEIDDQAGYITLTATMPEAYMAAQVAEKSQRLLQKYITNIKIHKATDEFNFVQNSYKKQEKLFYAAQEKLAVYNDSHKNVTSAKARTEFDRLSADYSLKLEVHNELAKQLEQAKLKVTKKTPSFSIIQEVTVPNEKSAPKYSLILTVWIFLGVFLGVLIIIITKNIKENWNTY